MHFCLIIVLLFISGAEHCFKQSLFGLRLQTVLSHSRVENCSICHISHKQSYGISLLYLAQISHAATIKQPSTQKSKRWLHSGLHKQIPEHSVYISLLKFFRL